MSEIISQPLKNTKRRSPVYEFYEDVTGESSGIRCKICLAEIYNNTTNLEKHLRLHKPENEKFLSLKAEWKASGKCKRNAESAGVEAMKQEFDSYLNSAKRAYNFEESSSSISKNVSNFPSSAKKRRFVEENSNFNLCNAFRKIESFMQKLDSRVSKVESELEDKRASKRNFDDSSDSDDFGPKKIKVEKIDKKCALCKNRERNAKCECDENPVCYECYFAITKGLIVITCPVCEGQIEALDPFELS